MFAPLAAAVFEARVVFPAHAKADDPIRFGDRTEDLALVVILVVTDEIEHLFHDFLHRLYKLPWPGLRFRTPAMK